VALIARAAPPDDVYSFTFCTGALIDDSLVVTASHCLVDRSNIDALIDPKTLCHPGPIRGQRVPVRSWEQAAGSSDVALVRLVRPVDTAPMNVTRTAEPHEMVTAWGWGGSDDGVPPCQATPKTIRAVEPARSTRSGGRVATDAWCGVPSGSLNTCRGDSGGPVIDQEGDLDAIVGGGLSCGSTHAGSYVTVGPIDTRRR